MEIKTKYNIGDHIYFLTWCQDHLDDNAEVNHGDIFVCEAKVMRIKTILDGNEINTTYSVCSARNKWDKIDEKFCAPDPTQLGLDVSNKYYLSKKRKS
jgi:hypothetical protein